MKELISINVNEDGIQTVSARELHEKLQISERFSTWFERMLKYGFEKNVDYTSVKVFTEVQNNGGTQKRELQEHYILLDMAKEICMIQRSEIGRKFRQYFIECENKLKEVVETGKISNSISDNQFKLESAKLLREIGLEYQGQSKTYKQILDAHATKILTGDFLLPLPKAEQKSYSATEVGQIVAKSLNKAQPISAVMIGRCAAWCGLRNNEEYGVVVHDVNHGRECDTFRYFENAVDVIKNKYDRWFAIRNNKKEA